ncbi:uncharacterized protein LOC125458017 [Stegostoma tigrinum]|uniref:uncharacterized protein LOC125458017 n=1 Tax=Stegostoma tigrinum TaxID=3053191 RepID=UPI00202B627B|nr:uncharacterized protein LOC125458017 [Stegostoma tigrinum]
MHFFTKISEEEPELLPPTDWEGGYFCQHVGVFVLFYFSCVLIVLVSYSSLLQIYNGIRTVVKSCRKTQSVECKVNAPRGFLLFRLLASLKRRLGSMLGAVFSPRFNRKAHRRVHYSLEWMVPPAEKQLKYGRPSRHYKRYRTQYLRSASGEILCYLPYKMIAYPYAAEISTGIHKYGDFNLIDMWSSSYSRTGYKCMRSVREKGLRRSVSMANFENRLEMRPRLLSPTYSYKRIHFT